MKRRLVRLHQEANGPTVEGILVSGRTANHYHLRAAVVIESPNRSHALESGEAWVPRERVVLVESIKNTPGTP